MTGGKILRWSEGQDIQNKLLRLVDEDTGFNKILSSYRLPKKQKKKSRQRIT
jgi:formiminotetrahydrofolate cyclodeaminase